MGKERGSKTGRRPRSGAARRRQQARELDGVQVRLPTRTMAPDQVLAHLGPTNSGKTHAALQALREHGHGVYAAPLRMLAREAYERLRTDLGDRVGLRTGEEEINAGAPILCATTEMTPMRGRLLVLDETHWAADPARGSAWTRLLLGGDYQRLLLLGAPDVLPLLQACFGERLQLQAHQRLGALHWADTVTVEALQPGDAVAAYSRRSVLYLAGLLAERYGAERVAALYGAMPLTSRLQELERLRSGGADLLVCTDVLGHGLNLPVRRLLFAETDKWDGQQRRALEPWEAGQIAGRAGRYGQHPDGWVGVLGGVPWYAPKSSVARAGLQPRQLICPHPELYAFDPILRARLRPELEDLGAPATGLLARAVRSWHQQAATELGGLGWIDLEDPQPLLGRLGVISGALGDRRDELSAEDAWTLACGPLDPEEPRQARLLAHMARARQGRGDLGGWLSGDPRQLGLEEAEELARVAAALRWYAGRFGDGAGISASRARRVEEQAAAQVNRCLSELLRSAPAGCTRCGGDCAPWLSLCPRCS